MWDFFKNIFNRIGDFLKEFVRSNAGEMVEGIGDIAYAVVKQIEETAQPGDNKFKLAKEALTKELIKRGIVYTESVLNTAIEIAVDLLKERGEEYKK